MKLIKKSSKFNLIKIFVAGLFAAMLVFGVIAANISKAYAYQKLPSEDEIIGNLYKGNGKFSKENLDDLAHIIDSNYTMDDLVTAVKNGTVETQTSEAFGDTLVKLGKFTNKTTKQEEDLVWMPTYLSTSISGEPILTLWLANTAVDNSTVSDQETSYVAEGKDGEAGYNVMPTTNPSSNNYSTSYIRSVILNNGSKYIRGYDSARAAEVLSFDNGLTEVTHTPTSDGSNKFEDFTTGDLSNFIVTPKNVSWQKDANYSKNDPKWTGGSTTTYPNMDAWLNDKLWLPSVHEVFDEAPSSTQTEFTCDGGLWKTTVNERVNSWWTRLRSGHPNAGNLMYYVYYNDGSCAHNDVNHEGTVRPALHLNLSKVAENAVPAEPHVSELEQHEAQVATCTNEGNIEYWYCATCDKYYSDEAASTEITDITTITTGINPANHASIVQHAAKTATCTEAGNSAYWHCTGCNKYFSDAGGTNEIAENSWVIKATGHSYSTEWSSNDDYHWHAATCGHTTETKDKAAHTWDEGTVTTEPTCTAAGEKTFTCTVCEATKTEPVEKLSHKYTETVTAPTCTEQGYTTHTCKRDGCGDTYIDTYTDPLGHSWGEWNTTRQPTETVEGEKERECSECGEKETAPVATLSHTHTYATEWSSDKDNHWHAATCAHTTETKDKAAHSWDSGKVTTEPTCTAAGVKTYTCTVCGRTKTEPVEKLSHKYMETVTAPTCTEQGYTTHTCSACGDNYVDGKTEALGHEYSTEWSKDETNHWHACTRCGDIAEQAHIFDDFEIIKQPTTTETGTKQWLCSVCGALGETEEIAKLVEDEDGNGDVSGLPTDKEYDLEIAVKESDSLYNIPGISKGFNVELFVVNGEDRNPYDDSKTVVLTLVIPDGMEGNFTLYRRQGDVLERVEKSAYTVEGRMLRIKTTLPIEYVFNSPSPEEPEEPEKAGIPWWVWLIVGVGAAAVITLIIVLVAKKKKGGTPDPQPTNILVKGGTQYDDSELKRQMKEQNGKIDELLSREATAGAMEQTLSDDEMRSYFTDQELLSMAKDGKISQEDCNRIISGRKK